MPQPGDTADRSSPIGQPLTTETAVLTFVNALLDWQTNAFPRTLKRELEGLEAGLLPLHKGVCRGGHVDDSDICATFLSARDDGAVIRARVGIFFSEIIAGCSCGDDPTSENAYCEIEVVIDKETADARFALIPG